MECLINGNEVTHYSLEQKEHLSPLQPKETVGKVRL